MISSQLQLHRNGKRPPSASNWSQERESVDEEKDWELTNPDLGLPQSLPLRSEQELQSVASTLQQKEEISTKLAKKTKKTKILPQV